MIQIQTLLASFPQTRVHKNRNGMLSPLGTRIHRAFQSERQGLQLAKGIPFLLFSEKHGLLL